MLPRSPFARVERRWAGGRRPYCSKVTEPVWCVVPNSLAYPYGCQCKKRCIHPYKTRTEKAANQALAFRNDQKDV